MESQCNARMGSLWNTPDAGGLGLYGLSRAREDVNVGNYDADELMNWTETPDSESEGCL